MHRGAIHRRGSAVRFSTPVGGHAKGRGSLLVSGAPREGPSAAINRPLALDCFREYSSGGNALIFMLVLSTVTLRGQAIDILS